MTHRHSYINELMKTLSEYRTKEFKWGEHDCCLFVCDCVKAMTGIDPAENHRGHYSTELGAKKALVKYGRIEDVFDSRFSRVADHKLARRGDVLTYESELGTTMGVMWSDGVYAMGLDGIVKVNCEPLIIWRVV